MVKKLIKNFSELFLQKTQNKKIHLVSHYDTDGITSAAILSKTLEKLERQFSIKILKQLTEEEIALFPKDRLILLADLGSGSLELLSKLPNEIFIIDHHEISGTAGKNITFINPHLIDDEEISASGLTYLFAKEIDKENKNLANTATIQVDVNF